MQSASASKKRAVVQGREMLMEQRYASSFTLLLSVACFSSDSRSHGPIPNKEAHAPPGFTALSLLFHVFRRTSPELPASIFLRQHHHSIAKCPPRTTSGCLATTTASSKVARLKRLRPPSRRPQRTTSTRPSISRMRVPRHRKNFKKRF